MSGGKLDFNLTSTGVALTGTAATPDELRVFIARLEEVHKVFGIITCDSDRSGEAMETGTGSTEGESAGP